ncbi:50S ribosomal protein L10 [Candidatus Woesearchaeota archaeon]|nr:50S ribosomal protein L10 [Candidatus Woesearchaeota archaeon]MBW3014427.1 50S ribosomal protein L10 [Candidatus Woesearchaeota archaeon]MBW3018425.1 50S ribosomal protein L10 [Candidatus Woesearchaeota archaeon]
MPADWKKRLVKDYEKLLEEYPVIGIVNFSSLPVPQLQQMREKLRKDVVIRGGRKKLFNRAIDNMSKKIAGLEKLKEYTAKGLPGILFTKENPFSLYKKLQKSKTAAPAKAGQTAPKDIVVPAGPTSFSPGPIIGELGSAGIKAGIEGGKVVIKADSTVVKEGQEINAQMAGLLSRLGIHPMEIGLNIVAIFEEGTVYPKSVLSIDEKKFIEDLGTAGQWAFNLAMNAGILTKETTELMITKAFNDAKALALAQDIMADAVMEDLLAKANAQMQSVKQNAKL